MVNFGRPNHKAPGSILYRWSPDDQQFDNCTTNGCTYDTCFCGGALYYLDGNMYGSNVGSSKLFCDCYRYNTSSIYDCVQHFDTYYGQFTFNVTYQSKSTDDGEILTAVKSSLIDSTGFDDLIGGSIKFGTGKVNTTYEIGYEVGYNVGVDDDFMYGILFEKDFGPNRCDGYCNYRSEYGCYCDGQCKLYGDCCYDVCDTCYTSCQDYDVPDDFMERPDDDETQKIRGNAFPIYGVAVGGTVVVGVALIIVFRRRRKYAVVA